VRLITDMAPSAFLASSHLVWPLVSSILSPIAKDCFNTTLAGAERRCVSLRDVTPPGSKLHTIQRAWDDTAEAIKVAK